jgi:hypothetical protein
MVKRRETAGGAIGGYHTEERVRELAGHIFSEEEVAVCVSSTKLTEEQIIDVARCKVRRAWEETDRRRVRTDPMMQERIAGLFKQLSKSLDATLPVKRADPFDMRKLAPEAVAEIEARWKSPVRLSPELHQSLQPEDWEDQPF